jgi:ABC-type sugar transport system substrate-binding protein
MQSYSRRFVTAAAACVGCAIALGACGSSKTTSTSDTARSSAATAPTPKNLTIAGVTFDDTDPYFISMKCGAQAEAKSLGVTLNWQPSAQPDVSSELTTLNSVATSNPSGVILDPTEPVPFDAPVKSLMAKGTPVVTVDGHLGQNVALKSVTVDYSGGASALIAPMEQALGSHGTLGIIAYQAGNSGDMQKYDPVIAAVRKALPGVKILPIEYTLADTTKAASDAAAMIQGNPGLNVIYASNGPEGVGAAAGIMSGGAAGKVKLFSFDAVPQEVSGVKAGTFQAIVGGSPYLEGKLAVETLATYLRGSRIGDAITPASAYSTTTGVKLMNKANVDAPSSQPYHYLASCS